jgi:hypothetical protein
MGFTVCPAAAIAAPVEVVWANLVHWERYADWADVWVERLEPSNPITLGQPVIFTGKAFGRILRFSFQSTRSLPNDSGSMVSVLPLRAARENTPCLHAHRCDQLSRPIWLRLPRPPGLGSAPRNLWREPFAASAEGALRRLKRPPERDYQESQAQ